MSWVDVGALAEMKWNPGAPVKIADHWIALFQVGGELRAIDNRCTHASAPLCDGTVIGESVACFLHCWKFDLKTGACDVGAQWNVRTYGVQVVDGRVQVDWPGPAVPGQAS